jgi:hypothetical protein
MNRITLSIAVTGHVMATYTGDHAAQIRALFHTDTLPTAFSFDGAVNPETFGADALRALRAANLECVVEWHAEKAAHYAAFQANQRAMRRQTVQEVIRKSRRELPYQGEPGLEANEETL